MRYAVIGEALGKLRRTDPEVAAQVPGLANAGGLRNVLVHGDAPVADERVYDTAVSDVPELISALGTLMVQAGGDSDVAM